MTWAEYYERYDGWQESTQYSRLASIKDFGSDGSPSEEICDCIQYVDTRESGFELRKLRRLQIAGKSKMKKHWKS